MLMQRHDHYGLEQAWHDHVGADREQARRCAHGEHDMLATASPGVVVCRFCRTLGVCLWCGMTLPQGACIVVCATHVGAVHWQAKQHQSRSAGTGTRRSFQHQESEEELHDL